MNKTDAAQTVQFDPNWDGKHGTIVFKKTNGRIRRDVGRFEIDPDAQAIRVWCDRTGYYRKVPFEYILKIIFDPIGAS